MPKDDSFRTFVAEQLAVLGPVTLRSMFGGAGAYHDGVMFALIAFDTLYFKADDGNRADYEAEGTQPFSYETKGGRNTIMSYWQVPERLYDDPDEMRSWVRKAFEAALRSSSSKQARKPSGSRVAKKNPRRGRADKP